MKSQPSEMPNFREPALGPTYPEFLHGLCRKASFNAGDIVRHQDQYYKEIYLVTEGWLDVLSGSPERGAPTASLGPGSTIGEIGVRQGSRAAATIVARTAASALVIDYDTMWKIHEGDRSTAVQFCRYLAKVSQPIGSTPSIRSLLSSSDKASNVDVSICQNNEILHEVLRLRYSIGCVEFGRESPDADDEKKTLSDRFDSFGYVFVAVKDGELIGSLRANLSTEGSMGIFEELYGMKSSRHHPDHTAICGRFIIKKSNRNSPVFLKLCIAFLDYLMKRDVVECYVGCEPHLTSVYGALGFKRSAERFFHYDFGPNDPMVLDLTQHGKRLCRLAGIQGYFG